MRYPACLPNLSGTLLCALLLVSLTVAASASSIEEKREASLDWPHNDVAMHGHLYVAAGPDGVPGVYRFPLKNGLPATKPDAVLTGGLSWALSVAFDGAGYMYVTDYFPNLVKVYAPGATGDAQPVRVIPVPQEPTEIAVTTDGYLYVIDGNYGLEVFAPGAGGGPGGPVPQPLHAWGSPDGTALGDLVVDSSGRLYAQDLFGPIYVYDDAIHHWQTPDRVIEGQGGFEGNWLIAPEALEQGANRLWFQMYPNVKPPYQYGSHAGRDLNSGGPVPDVISLSKDCHGNGGGDEYGLAVNQDYLMFSCNENYVALLVYRNAPGRQSLVEVVQSPNMASLNGIILGP